MSKQQTIEDSFTRAFAQSVQRPPKRPAEEMEHSDSEDEAVRKNDIRVAKKKKPVKEKRRKTVNQFKVTRKVQMVSVTTESDPIIGCIDDEFKNMTQVANDANLVTESDLNWFKKQNHSQGTSYDHLRPHDFPKVRATLLVDPKPIHDIQRQNNRDRPRPNVEGVSRKEEEEALIEPDIEKGERPCLRGQDCEGKYIACNQPFICKEFFLKSERERIEQTGQKPAERKLCLMCTRADIARAHFNIIADGKGMRQDNVLSNYFNYVDVEGEYRAENCIRDEPGKYQGLPFPIVRHTRCSYVLGTTGEKSLRCYKQWKYGVYVKGSMDF